MTIEEAVQEIKDYIDIQKADMLSKMNNKFEIVKNFLYKSIKEGSIVVELPDKKLKGRKKRYQS